MKYFMMLILSFLSVVMGDAGSGQSFKPSVGPPVCSSSNPDWVEMLKDVAESYENMTEAWKVTNPSLDASMAKFVQLQLSGVYVKIFECLPEFLKTTDRFSCDMVCDYPLEGEDSGDIKKIEEEIQPSEGNWMDKVKGMLAKAKDIITKSLKKWEEKDTFLLFCSVPGVISALVMMGRFCIVKRLKRYERVLQRPKDN